MRTFKCKLVRDGFDTQLSFRQGKSREQVLLDLKEFDFGLGKWVVVEHDEDEDINMNYEE